MAQGIKGTKTMALCHPDRVSVSHGRCSNCDQKRRRDNGQTRKPSKEENRSRFLGHLYNLSISEYAQMFANQHGVCAICSQPETRRNQHGLISLAVDHCHRTGAVRGLLCHRCNAALGFLDDDLAKLTAAVGYLKSHQP